MTGKRFSIDIYDNTLINRVFKMLLGILCLVAAVYFFLNVKGTTASTTTTWIAVVFLILFGLWGVLSGAGFIDRYIFIEEDKITIRQNPLALPDILTPADLKNIEFGPLTIYFSLQKGSRIILRLGTYNSQRSAAIMEEVKEYCSRNNVETKGLNVS